ncbi:MAG: hypothetical protein IKE53_00745 [Clostridiales bacterium]|nr:hypothetical protein [Clostridiales bacterium]
MNYFFANLAAHGVACLILIVLLIIFTNRNFKRKTKYAVSYFIPVLLLIAFGVIVIRYMAPRIFDINNVIGDVTYSYTGRVESVSELNNYFVVDGVTYFIDPRRGDLEVGRIVKVRYTPSSNYAMSVSYNVNSEED